MYRSLNSYPRLADETIEGNPDQKTDAELDAAIPILDRLYSREVKGGDRTLRPAEAATCDDGCLLCRACRNRRRGRATSRRSRRGCSRSRQRRRWQRDIFSFRRCQDLQCCRRSCAARAVYRGEGAGHAAGGIARPGVADRHPPLRLWLDPVVTTTIRSARDFADCGR
jgi:Bacterial archaeo-eukaryotic release factor family 8